MHNCVLYVKIKMLYELKYKTFASYLTLHVGRYCCVRVNFTVRIVTNIDLNISSAAFLLPIPIISCTRIMWPKIGQSDFDLNPNRSSQPLPTWYLNN